MGARPRAFPLRVFLVAGVAVAMGLVLVPFRRITTDLVTIATEQEGHKNLEDAARLAHQALRSGVRAEALVSESFSCICDGARCAGACPNDLVRDASQSLACDGDPPDRVCIVRRDRSPSTTPLRMAHALLALATITVFAVTSLVLALVLARPLRALAAEAKRVGDGRPALPPTGSFVEEIQSLEAALGSMVERLRAREAEVQERLLHAQDANDELQRANRTLAETRQQLLQAERLAAVGRLSAGLAHEIGNPLTAILALLDLVLAGDLPEAQQRDFLERIRAENERIGTIVRGLLDFSRPDLPMVDAPEGNCSPQAVVDDLLRFFEPQRRYAHARFALAGDRTDRNVRMHSGALRQVLLNLFLNAAEALESRKSPGLVLVAFEDAGDVVRILVEDDGPGVEAAVGDRLFEPFVTSRGDRGGTGLGLSICRGLVEATGGRLELERTSKAGTRFAVTLPVAAT